MTKRLGILASLVAGLLLIVLSVAGQILPVDDQEIITSQTAVPAPAFVLDLGTLGGPSSVALTLNDAGVVVGDATQAAAGTLPVAFRWQNNTLIAAPTVGGYDGSKATAINASGQIAGILYTQGVSKTIPHAAIAQGSILTPIAIPGSSESAIFALNRYSLAAGVFVDATNGRHAFTWRAGVFTQLPGLGSDSWAWDVNDAGQAVGYAADENGLIQAVRWHNGTVTPLGTSTQSHARAINEAGQIVGWVAANQGLTTRAFLWQTASGVTPLPSLGNPAFASSQANGINEAGVMVGWAEGDDGLRRAVRWQNGQVEDLNAWLPPNSGWQRLESANAINSDGWIVGTGLKDGQIRAFLLMPPFVAYLPVMAKTELRSPYDMREFLMGDGRLYEVLHSSGGQARHQTQLAGGKFFHTKGNETVAEWEELWADNRFIYRGTDTSPGNGLYYTLRENGRYGSAWAPRYWAVGGLFQRHPEVTFYRKSDCGFAFGGYQSSWLKFEAYYPQYTFPGGIRLNNVAQLAWLLTPTGEPIERYYYAQSYGLVGWWSRDNGMSSIREIHPPGTRPDNGRESIPCLNQSYVALPALYQTEPLVWPDGLFVK